MHTNSNIFLMNMWPISAVFSASPIKQGYEQVVLEYVSFFFNFRSTTSFDRTKFTRLLCLAMVMFVQEPTAVFTQSFFKFREFSSDILSDFHLFELFFSLELFCPFKFPSARDRSANMPD